MRSVRCGTPVIRLRPATPADADTLGALIDSSVRELQRDTYSARQIELALAHVYGIDSALIADGTYFAVEAGAAIVACGGWSRRATLYGGDVYAERRDDVLVPGRDAAKVRAFFVHPGWARRGLGSLLLAHCERQAAAAGFTRAELAATLAGVPFYAARGYVAMDSADVPLPGGEHLAVVRMERALP